MSRHVLMSSLGTEPCATERNKIILGDFNIDLVKTKLTFPKSFESMEQYRSLNNTDYTSLYTNIPHRADHSVFETVFSDHKQDLPQASLGFRQEHCLTGTENILGNKFMFKQVTT